MDEQEQEQEQVQVQGVAVAESVEGRERTGEGSGAGQGQEQEQELTALRAALLRAYPRAVPELVGGGSVGEMLASLEGAMAAWDRVAAAVAGATASVERPPVVPAGAAPAAAIDPERLPATEKIRRGLLGRRG